MKVSILWIMILILTMLMGGLVNLIQKKMEMQKQKWTQFECGFNTMTPTHIPFSFQFFLIAILFLIFDIEIAMVLSFPMEKKTIINMLIIFLFLLILTFGLIYEWQKGKIEWSK